MMLLIFLITSCLTIPIELTGYEEIDVKELKGKPEREKIIALSGLIDEMDKYIEYLTEQILKAHNKRVIVQDLREGSTD